VRRRQVTLRLLAQPSSVRIVGLRDERSEVAHCPPSSVNAAAPPIIREGRCLGWRASTRPAEYPSRELPPYSDEKLRIVTGGISGGGSLTGPLRDARRFPSTRWFPVPGGYAYDVGVWDLSIVQGPFSVAPVPNLKVTIRNFCIAVEQSPPPVSCHRLP
jgi:hypothetical protein